jgi:ribonuclease HI
VNKEIIIFTDGASRGNPGPGGWGAVIIFPQGKGDDDFQFSRLQTPEYYNSGQVILNFQKPTDDLSHNKNNNDNIQVVELGGRQKNTTNNQMEITAAIEAISFISFSKISQLPPPILIYTDSSYLINGITKWVYGWQKNNWKTTTKGEVLNKTLWEKLIEVSKDKKIDWKYVSGHSGIKGNERCDEIATAFADNIKIDLYSGPLSEYKIDVLRFDIDKKISKKRNDNKARSKKEPYSYVSEVNGVIEIHKTWLECEKRVKGKSKTRYKKAVSKDEEKMIVKEFKAKSE